MNRYAVDVTTTAVRAGRHESTCTCSCGWRLTTSAATSQMATRVSDRARANHFRDAHPEQRSSAAPLTPQAQEHGHTPALSSARKDGFLWARTLVCACDWETSASGRTPLEAADAARSQHQRHVRQQARGSHGSDRLVLLGILAMVVTLVVAFAAYASSTSLF